jgi:hypothetical protein
MHDVNHLQKPCSFYMKYNKSCIDATHLLCQLVQVSLLGCLQLLLKLCHNIRAWRQQQQQH